MEKKLACASRPLSSNTIIRLILNEQNLLKGHIVFLHPFELFLCLSKTICSCLNCCTEKLVIKKTKQNMFTVSVLEAIKDNPALQKAHLGLPQEEIEEQMKRQLEE